MSDSQANLAWDVLLDLSGPGSLHRRLTRSLRSAITSGRLADGVALPPSRTLAATLGCSRWSVTEAYSQLIAEGYLAARAGSATRVRWTPDRSVPTPSTRTAAGPSARWDLAPGLPDLRAFPRRRWADAVRRATSAAADADLGFPDVRGNPALRGVLAGYLGRVRGVELTGAEVIVTTSATAGVGLVSRVLAADGITTMGVEDPGWTRLHAPIRAAGLDLVPIGVDDDGLRVDDLERHPDVRAVVVTPAHQFPRGVVLAPHRRAALLEWARRVSGVVVEDDYDAEFRYDGRAVGALQGMEPGRVFLAGSVSKTLSPAVGLGWLVVPGPWLSSVAEQLARPTPPTLDQLAFADLVTTGGYDRHLRSRRQAFRRRRTALVEALDRRLPDCPISGLPAGLHLTLTLPEGSDAAAVVTRARRRGVDLVDAASYRIGDVPDPPALVLGYGNLVDSAVDDAAAQLAAAVRT